MGGMGNAVLARVVWRQASALVGRPVRGTAVFLSPRRGHHLFSLLRAELLKSLPSPLSSDAFTGFGWHDAAVHNREVKAATELMTGSMIDMFAQDLLNRRVMVYNGTHLTTLMHERGGKCCVRARARARVCVCVCVCVCVRVCVCQ